MQVGSLETDQDGGHTVLCLTFDKNDDRKEGRGEGGE